MAQYEHLPIYREAFKFLIYCETIVQHFSRYHKYTHGSDLRDTVRTIIKIVHILLVGYVMERRIHSILEDKRTNTAITMAPDR